MEEIVKACRLKYKENQDHLPPIEVDDDEVDSGSFEVPAPPYLHPATKRIEIEGKGRGIIATKRIKKGELIAHETPFVSGEKNFTMTAKKALSSDSKRQNLSELGINYHIATDLRHRCGDVPKGVRGVTEDQWIEALIKVVSNCFMAPVNGELALFHYLSFFNHSCWPNATLDKDYHADSFCGIIDPAAALSTSPISKSTKLYALVDIPKDTEICFSYFPLTIDPENERERLFQKLGFRCQCGHCSIPQHGLLKSFKRTPTPSEIDKMIQGFDEFIRSSKEFIQLEKGSQDDDELTESNEAASSNQSFLFKIRSTHEDQAKIKLIRDIYRTAEEFELISDFLSDEHWRKLEWRRKWASILMFLNRHEDALPLVIDLIQGYRNVLPLFHVQYQTAYKMLSEINLVVGSKSFSKDLLVAMKEASNITDFFDGGTHDGIYMRKKREASWKSTLTSWNAR